MRKFLVFLSLLVSFVSSAKVYRSDVLVYGATPSGIIAAVQAARMGKEVVVLEPSRWIGGMVSGGLSSTDVGFTRVISGTTQEFFDRTNKIEKEKGANPSNRWMLEPHVATYVFREMLQEAGVVLRIQTKISGVDKVASRILALSTQEGDLYEASQYIDATYEGDLMARVGVSYTWGREASTTYSEPDAGVQKPELIFGGKLDPYVRQGIPSSGLIFSVTEGPLLPVGSADKKVMAYNYRHCASQNKENAIPYSQLAPSDYDPYTYAGVRRTLDYLRALLPARSGESMARIFFSPQRTREGVLQPYANSKYDINGGAPFSSDVVKYNQLYPDGDEQTRDLARKKIANYGIGLFHFLVTDPSVPESVKDFVDQFGACKDEFVDNNNFPTQLYVREARRMQSDYVMTEKNVLLQTSVEDSIALAGYNVDTHLHQLVSVDGKLYAEGAKNAEGYNTAMVDFCTPYGISYGAIKPKAEQAINLLVPVAISASAVANGSLRLEPQYMMMGQAAGTAASLAIDSGKSVQDVSYEDLHRELMDRGQLLNIAQDYMIMKVCIDPADNSIQYGKTPLDADCKFKRQIRIGERVPYHLSSMLEKKQDECRTATSKVIVEARDNVPMLHDGVTRIVSALHKGHNACSENPRLETGYGPQKYEVFGGDKEFAFKMGEWANEVFANGVLRGGISELCSKAPDGTLQELHNSRRYYRQQIVSRSVVYPSGTAENQRFWSLPSSKGLASLSEKCPSKYEPTLSFWARNQFNFGARDFVSTSQDTIISDLYIGHSSPELGYIMERSYFAKDFGKLRQETWRREDWNDGKAEDDPTKTTALSLAKKLYESGACSKPYVQKNTVTLTFGEITTEQGAYEHFVSDSTISGHRWYMVTCEDSSNLILAKNPVGDPAPTGSLLPGAGNTPAPHAAFWDFWAK
ncbi:MAG: FAD-dependent oxidoreductase [Bdellovibrionota bacterium]